MSTVHPVYLIKGDDPALTGQALRTLVDELVGDRPVDATLEDVSEDADASAVIDAAQTPSFLTDRRVVVVRSAGRFRADQVDPLVSYLTDPMPSTSLVLVAGGGAMPVRLTKAIKEHGHVIDAAVPQGKGRQAWLAERLKNGPVRLNRQSAELLGSHLGDELGQITGLLESLAAAYGEGAAISSEQLEPFLGAGGAATPWELTDAIDKGDTQSALAHLRRMLEGGQRHPLVVMATLQRHVSNLMRLDGAAISSEADAARLLGVAPYPAKKAMTQAAKLGSPAIGRAIRLTSQADIDLRGASAWPQEVVLEVLVARLTKLSAIRHNDRNAIR